MKTEIKTLLSKKINYFGKYFCRKLRPNIWRIISDLTDHLSKIRKRRKGIKPNPSLSRILSLPQLASEARVDTKTNLKWPLNCAKY